MFYILIGRFAPSAGFPILDGLVTVTRLEFSCRAQLGATHRERKLAPQRAAQIDNNGTKELLGGVLPVDISPAVVVGVLFISHS